MTQPKAHYWHFDVWNKAAKAKSFRITCVRFSLRTSEKLMVTSADGTVTEYETHYVDGEFVQVPSSLDVHWTREGHAYVMGVRDSKYDINLRAYAGRKR